MSGAQAILLLRLAGPLQSWGGASEYNRRETQAQPTKSGVVGLLAAAAGRPRHASITDLAGLRMAVRVDQAGSLLRDYHTVSDHRGRPLLSSQVNAKGAQKPTSPAKYTHVTQRYYLQDAAFVAALQGPAGLVEGLERAVRHPAFPLALGRRSCPPSRPLVIAVLTGPEAANIEAALAGVPWQAAAHARRVTGPSVDLAATIEDPDGDDTAADVPISFDFHAPAGRTTTRRIRHTWLTVPTSQTVPGPHNTGHDPFALLG